MDFFTLSPQCLEFVCFSWWNSLLLFWAAFPSVVAEFGELGWKMKWLGMGLSPLIPLLWESFPLGNSGKQWVSQAGREGCEGISQDKCEYAKWNHLFYLHEMISERAPWERWFGWWKGWNLREQSLTQTHLSQRSSLIKLRSWHLCQSWALKRE